MIDRIEELFQQQSQRWSQLAKGLEGLAHARTRAVNIDWFQILIRHIPHRMVSTTAPVDSESISRRPCFLCADNLPREEEGLAFGDDFTIYCNPYPIVERHLTIAHREHRPQRIANQFGRMLDLAAALSAYFIIYNGPECGASAPDHMHFQAGLRGEFPIEKETADCESIAVRRYARNALVLRGRDRRQLAEQVDRAVSLLQETTAARPAEPLLNLAVVHERETWVAYLFPRAKHRPDVFHTGQLKVSPAAIDLCGIFVVPRAEDFERIDGEAIASIFREITLPDDEFRKVAETLERPR